MDLHRFGGHPVIIGGGIAGLICALRLAPEPVTILSEAPLGAQASSTLAQGGLAASLGADDDADRHLADTLAAGDGLCDPAVARRIIEAAPAAVERLAGLGVRFDLGADGAPSLGHEAAHSRRRIIHAAGDGTGWEIMRVLVEAVRRTSSIRALEGFAARRLIVTDNAVVGVLAAGPSGPAVLATRRVVIATGGLGGLYLETSNPVRCFGLGLALAARAGAMLADLEFVQFHPTALDVGARPMPLISEAVRGEGAVLVNEAGERFMAGEPGAERWPPAMWSRARCGGRSPRATACSSMRGPRSAHALPPAFQGSPPVAASMAMILERSSFPSVLPRTTIWVALPSTTPGAAP
jgi:L-aspartate oxidase